MNEITSIQMVPSDRENRPAHCDTAPAPRLGTDEAAHLAAVFKAVGHPVRLQILDLISQGSGQVCSCDIERHFHLTQPTISHHLKILRDAGLIVSEAAGVWSFHQIRPAAVSELRDLLADLTGEKKC